ncbi:hypothetical protein ACIQXU_03535 [Peribacillus sp. NPDC097284]|uniref:hypothetical protein n=1 Tax=Peribacillus sp. NPDC097284 TaxID=3364401 RepID=UPI0037FE8E4B
MKRFFKFIAKLNEGKAQDEFFRNEYENYLKMNSADKGNRRLAPMLYVIDGGKKDSHTELLNRIKSS